MFSFLEIPADFVTYSLLKLAPDTHAAEALRFFLYDTMKVFLLLIVIIFLVTYLRSYLPRERVRRLLAGQHRFLGHVLAAFTGIVTPFCTCSAIPLFLGFLEAGVPLGVTFTFLVASPMINEVAIGLLLGLFGWNIVLLYVGSGLLIAIVSGLIIGSLPVNRLLTLDQSADMSVFSGGEYKTQKDRLAFARRVTNAIVRRVWLFVLFGISLGSLIHGFAPANLLSDLTDKSGFLGVPIATAIGVPLYSNAAGILPLISALVEKGLPIGTALAFMMSVTALSLPEFLILRRIMKTRLIILFALTVSLGIIATGYLFNAVIG